jgi:putative oxidoreductase
MRFQKILAAHGPGAILMIRLLVGGVFFLEGIKKFIFVEQWGAGRFARIGIPSPGILGPFVGVVEIVCSFLILTGLLTRLASIPLFVVICVAIATTKIPILLRLGFWPMEAEARTDYSMLMGLLFLILAGAGAWSIDAWLAAKTQGPNAQ